MRLAKRCLANLIRRGESGVGRIRQQFFAVGVDDDFQSGLAGRMNQQDSRVRRRLSHLVAGLPPLFLQRESHRAVKDAVFNQAGEKLADARQHLDEFPHILGAQNPLDLHRHRGVAVEDEHVAFAAVPSFVMHHIGANIVRPHPSDSAVAPHLRGDLLLQNASGVVGVSSGGDAYFLHRFFQLAPRREVLAPLLLPRLAVFAPFLRLRLAVFAPFLRLRLAVFAQLFAGLFNIGGDPGGGRHRLPRHFAELLHRFRNRNRRTVRIFRIRHNERNYTTAAQKSRQTFAAAQPPHPSSFKYP